MDSFESGTGVRHLINAALSNARTIAVREQTYAGVRFQQDKDGNTHMIFIVHDPAATGGDAQGFRAVIGRKPMGLPEEISVSATVRKSVGTTSEEDSFSVVFSANGKLTVHEVQCLHGSANDTIFNVAGSDAMFVEEEEADVANSVQSFTIETKDGTKTTEHISPYTGELVMEYRQRSP
jgi:Tfp pilus assembly protein FimT